tara:strand:+ start:1002 stop:1331 length:330 start_codon:yes stop_codon:yes gene_type:complete
MEQEDFECRLCNDERQCVYITGAKTPCPLCNVGEWEIWKHNEFSSDDDSTDENLCVDCNCIVTTGKERCLPCYKIYGQKMVLCMGCFKTKHKAAYAMCYYCNLKKRLKK